MTRDSEKFKTTRHFSNVSKEQLSVYGKIGSTKQRSLELQKAWAESNQIKSAFKLGIKAQEIADQYGIKLRQVYRIVNDCN